MFTKSERALYKDMNQYSERFHTLLSNNEQRMERRLARHSIANPIAIEHAAILAAIAGTMEVPAFGTLSEQVAEFCDDGSDKIVMARMMCHDRCSWY